MKTALFITISVLLSACAYHNKMRFVKVKQETSPKQTEMIHIAESSKMSTSAIEEKEQSPEVQVPSSLELDSVQESTTSIAAINSTEIKHPSKKVVNRVIPEVTNTNRQYFKKENKREEKDASLWLAMGGLGMSFILGMGLVKKKDRAMRISHWAKRNKRTSIGIIIASKLAMAGAGLYAGKLLLDSGFHISPTLTHSLVVAMFLAGVTYPKKHSIRGFWKHRYLKQKMHDLTLILMGFLIVVAIGNQKSSMEKVARSSTRHVHSIASTPNSHSFNAQSQLHALNNPRFEQTKYSTATQNPKKERSIDLKILLTFLLLVFVALLSVVLTMLVCGLSCSGQELAAVLVGTGGIIALAALLFFGLRGIWRKKEPKKEPRYQVS